MLSILGRKQRHCDGVSRRHFLRIGGLAMGGLSLPQLLQAEAASLGPRGKALSHKAVIMIYLSGGPSPQDMYDLKMKAPVEIRGSFKPISTAVPGIQICEHMPRLAGMMAWVEPALGAAAGRDGWRIVSARLLRSRVARAGGGAGAGWRAVMDYRLRVVREG